MPKFDDTIRQAILRACEIAGSQKAFAEAAGISPQSISKYLHSGVRSISPMGWKLLYPHIAPYLPDGSPPNTESPFPVGTTVRLKSGGPLMTVDGVENGMAFCAWFQGDEISRARFSIPALSVQSDTSDKTKQLKENQ